MTDDTQLEATAARVETMLTAREFLGLLLNLQVPELSLDPRCDTDHIRGMLAKIEQRDAQVAANARREALADASDYVRMCRAKALDVDDINGAQWLGAVSDDLIDLDQFDPNWRDHPALATAPGPGEPGDDDGSRG